MPKISAAAFESDFPKTKEAFGLLAGAMILHKKLGQGVIKAVDFSPIPKITVVFSCGKISGEFIYQISNLKDVFVEIDLSPEKWSSLQTLKCAKPEMEEPQGRQNTPVSFLSVTPKRYREFAKSTGERWKMLIGMGANHKRHGDGKIVNVEFNYVPGFFILFPKFSAHRTVFCSIYDFERDLTQVYLSSDLYLKIVQLETRKSLSEAEKAAQTKSEHLIKQQQAAAKPARKSRAPKMIPVKGSLPKTVVKCPECQNALRLKNIVKHYAKAHPQKPVPEKVKQVSEKSLSQLKRPKRRKSYWERTWTRYSGGVIYPISMAMIRIRKR